MCNAALFTPGYFLLDRVRNASFHCHWDVEVFALDRGWSEPCPVSLIGYNPPRVQISGAATLLILRSRFHAAYSLLLLSTFFSLPMPFRGALLLAAGQVIGKMPMPLLSARQLFIEGF